MLFEKPKRKNSLAQLLQKSVQPGFSSFIMKQDSLRVEDDASIDRHLDSQQQEQDDGLSEAQSPTQRDTDKSYLHLNSVSKRTTEQSLNTKLSDARKYVSP